jgi:hypothetical protein
MFGAIIWKLLIIESFNLFFKKIILTYIGIWGVLGIVEKPLVS